MLDKLVDSKWRQDRECDEILRQFRELLGLLQRRFKVECESFVVGTKRLDTFFHTVIGHTVIGQSQGSVLGGTKSDL